MQTTSFLTDQPILPAATDCVATSCNPTAIKWRWLWLAICLLTLVCGRSAVAQRFFDGGSSQVWDSSTANWSLASGGPYDQTWATGAAVFEGTGANVVVSGTIATVSSIQFDAAGYTLSGGSVPLSTTSPLVANADATISATIAGAGGIRKQGTGTLLLGASNTYAGVTFLDAGVLSIGDVAALGTGTGNNGRINFTGNGTLRYTGASAQVISTKFLFSDLANSSMTIDVSEALGELTITPTGGTRSRPFTKTGPGTLTMNGVFSGAASVTTNGGTLVLGAANTYSGATFFPAGVLSIGDVAALGTGTGNAGRLSFNGSGTLRYTGAGSQEITTKDLFSDNTGTSMTIEVSSPLGELAITPTGGTRNKPFTKSGPGTLAMNGAFTTSATITVDAGTLVLGAANSNSGSTTIAAGATLQVGSGSTAGGLGSGSVSNDGGLVVNRSDAVTMGQAISGGGSFSTIGTGAITLSGANSYTGATTVAAGTLLVNGSTATSSLTTVQAGATLGGTGSVGATLVENGAFHSPGTSPGVQTVTNGLQYDAGSTLTWELFANSTANRGTDYDGVDLTGGTLAIASGAILALDFGTTLAGSTVDWDDAFWGSDQSWTIIDVSGTGSWNGDLFDTITTGVDTLGRSLATVRPNASFSLADVGGDLTLQYAAVPEPAGLLLAGLAAAAVVGFARRRFPLPEPVR